jgi:DNA-damage-inducible protein D
MIWYAVYTKFRIKIIKSEVLQMKAINSSDNHIVVFNDRSIRRAFVDELWWFSVIDVIQSLTDSTKPRDYWYKMKVRVKEEDGTELSTICRQLKLKAPDGKMRETDCANTEGLFRIIQSIPSSKAEPFKRWLAKVGYERVQEIEDPELASHRAREIYKAKGYSDAWIEKRMRGIQIRSELTEEWKMNSAFLTVRAQKIVKNTPI